MLRCMESGKWSLENGIYRNGSNIDTSFSDIQQDNLYLIEDSSWWFEYRAAVILKMLNLFLVKEKLLFDLGGEWIYGPSGTGTRISGRVDRTVTAGVC